MKNVYLFRLYSDDVQTLGCLTVAGKDAVFVCRTLELPDKNNRQNISCIPEGEYICRWTMSPHLGVETYEVFGVPNRAGIRIHSANYFFQIQGCIALGDSHKDINIDGNLDVIHSGDTVKRFAEFMNHEDFKLIIRKAA